MEQHKQLGDHKTELVKAEQETTLSVKWLPSYSGVIHIILELIIIVSIFVWFTQKINSLTCKVADLTSRLIEQETTTERHEMVLKKITTLLGNRKLIDDDSSVVSATQCQPQQQPSVVEQDSGVSLTDIGSLFGLITGMAPSSSQTQPPRPAPVVPKIEELDSELNSELAELKAQDI